MGFWKEKNGSYRVYCGLNTNGKQIRRRVKTKAEAEAILQKYKGICSQADKVLLALPESSKIEVVEILQSCAQYNVSLTTLFNDWMSRHCSNSAKSLTECGSLYMQSLETAGRRRTYIATMRAFIAALTDKIGYLHAPAVRLSDLETIQQQLPLKSRQTWRSRACSFWSWMVRKGYAVENIAEKLESPLVQRELPYILSIKQCRKLLSECPITSLGGLILMLFAGIRPAEAKKITQPMISLERKTITIGGTIAKTRAFRVIQMSENTLAWLEYYMQQGMRFPFSPALKQMTEQYAVILGLKSWPRDCLRHTAASMMLARDQSAEKVALELGNSPNILHRHYKNLVTEEDCKAFWKILPDLRKKKKTVESPK